MLESEPVQGNPEKADQADTELDSLLDELSQILHAEESPAHPDYTPDKERLKQGLDQHAQLIKSVDEALAEAEAEAEAAMAAKKVNNTAGAAKVRPGLLPEKFRNETTEKRRLAEGIVANVVSMGKLIETVKTLATRTTLELQPEARKRLHPEVVIKKRRVAQLIDDIYSQLNIEGLRSLSRIANYLDQLQTKRVPQLNMVLQDSGNAVQELLAIKELLQTALDRGRSGK